jgi:hypothetical protein
MKPRVLAGSVLLCALAACGLEGMFTNLPHKHYDRPASKLRGAVSWPEANPDQLAIEDATGAINPDSASPFDKTLVDGAFQIQLPSGSYSMLRVRGRAGNMELRTLVPFVGEESAVDGVNLDARSMTETLIVEAWLSANQSNLVLVGPGAYVGNGVTSGTRTLIRAAFDVDPAVATSVQRATQDLLHMVERVLARTNVHVTSGATFFREPSYGPDWVVTSSGTTNGSALAPQLFQLGGFDYDGVAGNETDSTKFDQKLADVARSYQPDGCADDSRIRLVFSVDFNQGALNGNCGVGDRFKWAKDAPGKQMYFVGWLHAASAVQDRALNTLLGAGVPNQLAMFDDGTNGDDVGRDNIWTISFDVPYTGTVTPLRIGYKYTWGTRGQVWTGSEEWPGNSRLLEVFDVNGDHYVHRRDIFGDEATNKDQVNLNAKGTGTVTWDTVLFGAAVGCTDGSGRPLHEVWEKPVTSHSACTCGSWSTPRTVGVVKKACTQ